MAQRGEVEGQILDCVAAPVDDVLLVHEQGHVDGKDPADDVLLAQEQRLVKNVALVPEYTATC